MRAPEREMHTRAEKETTKDMICRDRKELKILRWATELRVIYVAIQMQPRALKLTTHLHKSSPCIFTIIFYIDFFLGGQREATPVLFFSRCALEKVRRRTRVCPPINYRRLIIDHLFAFQYTRGRGINGPC
jgi:hypothetical protein